MAIRVIVCGAAGRMGREVVKAVHGDAALEVVGAVDVAGVGEDAGALAGVGAIGVRVSDGLAAVLKETNAEVGVVFATPSAATSVIRTLIEHGVSPVVGSTGWYDQVPEIAALSEQKNVPAFVAPNFAIGAALMMKFAQEAARYFDAVEIIELHHDKKVDAPSGTAETTAKLIAQAKGSWMKDTPTEKFTIEGVRGGVHEGIRVHSVRLPGFVAHQEVIFGGVGQTLTIRHDSTGRDSFMPGVLHAIKKVRSLKGLTVGLEKIL
jgi:4-hydroxy-tetrahydrodipicolinate reductase